MKISDNFLPIEDFGNIKKVLFDPSFPWHFNQMITIEEPEYTGEYYMTHVLYNQRQNYQSDYYSLIYPLLNKIQPKAMIRAKVNMYLNLGRGLKEHAPHTDYSFSHTGAVFSINTCDGYTRIGEDKIDSIENRLVTFDAGKPHNSTSTSNSKVRVNINLNYFE